MAAPLLVAGVFPASVSASIPTTTTVSMSPDPMTYGGTGTIHVNVSPAPTDGFVTVYVDSARSPGVFPLNAAGNVDIDYPGQYWSKPNAGQHSIQAVFDGTSGHAGSSSPYPPQAFEVSKAASSVGLELFSEQIVVGGSVIWVAQTAMTGTLTVYQVDGAEETVLYAGRPYNIADSQRPLPGARDIVSTSHVGVTSYYATLTDSANFEDSQSATVELESVEQQSTVSLSTNPTAPNEGDVVTLTAALGPGSGPQNFDVTSATGTITFKDTFNGATTVLGTTDIANGGATLELDHLRSGTHSLRAFYSGDDHRAEASSPALSRVVRADLVEVSGVHVGPATFYPVVDAYLDTVNVEGVLAEPASVTINVRSSSGSVVRTMALGVTNGAYQVAWDGKASNGRLVPAGKYRIAQTLVDGRGTRTTITKSVTVSLKKLVFSTVTTTQPGLSYDAEGKDGSGTVTPSSTLAHGVRLQGGNGWAGVAWQFSVKRGVVYKPIKFMVLGKGTVTGAVIGIQNWTIGHAWNTGNFDELADIGGPLGWHTTSGPGAPHVSSSFLVRGMALVGSGINYDVQTVKLTYTYGVLR